MVGNLLFLVYNQSMSRLPKFLLAAVCFLALASPALAVVNPQSGSSAVTATVPDNIAPSTPTLVSPANNSTIASSAPVFIFEPATDNVAVAEYELWIDGSREVDGITQSTSLTISTTAATALTDGQHTWKIIASDAAGNYTDSATWTFTVDTTAPLILITQIAEHSVSLSSQDPTTVPAGLQFTTTQSQPAFAGQSEANAKIVIFLSSASQSYTFTATADANANFSLTPDFQLGRDSYTVSISSTDAAANAATLPSFTLVIEPAPALTLALPSPLPPITIPFILLPRPVPRLPRPLQALLSLPKAGCPFQLLPWLIIVLLIIYILYLRRRLKKTKSNSQPS
jgi:hypothetical protein